MKEIRQMLLSGLEEVCNRALSLDEASKQAFADLEGKELNVQTFIDIGVSNFEFTFNISFCDNGLMISAPIDDSIMESDASVRVSSLKLFSKLITQQGLLEDDNIMIFGDRALVSRVQAILFNLDLDWEEPLSRITGDVLAHEIGRIAEDAKSLIKNSGEIFGSIIERRTGRNKSTGRRSSSDTTRSGGRRTADPRERGAISKSELKDFSAEVSELNEKQIDIETRAEKLFKEAGQ